MNLERAVLHDFTSKRPGKKHRVLVSSGCHRVLFDSFQGQESQAPGHQDPKPREMRRPETNLS